MGSSAPPRPDTTDWVRSSTLNPGGTSLQDMSGYTGFSHGALPMDEAVRQDAQLAFGRNCSVHVPIVHIKGQACAAPLCLRSEHVGAAFQGEVSWPNAQVVIVFPLTNSRCPSRVRQAVCRTLSAPLPA